MKRDMELVRKILLFIEDHHEGTSLINLKLDGYDKTTVAEHCKIMFDYGLLEHFKPYPADNDPYNMFAVGGLTWEGFDYLDKIRDDSMWGLVKNKLKEHGLPVLIDTVKSIASAYIQAKVNEAIGTI